VLAVHEIPRQYGLRAEDLALGASGEGETGARCAVLEEFELYLIADEIADGVDENRHLERTSSFFQFRWCQESDLGGFSLPEESDGCERYQKREQGPDLYALHAMILHDPSSAAVRQRSLKRFVTSRRGDMRNDSILIIYLQVSLVKRRERNFWKIHAPLVSAAAPA